MPRSLLLYQFCSMWWYFAQWSPRSVSGFPSFHYISKYLGGIKAERSAGTSTGPPAHRDSRTRLPGYSQTEDVPGPRWHHGQHQELHHVWVGTDWALCSNRYVCIYDRCRCRSRSQHPYVMYGESGFGKTSLLAVASIRVYDWIGDTGNLVVVRRFLGTTPDSTNIETLLTSVCWQITTYCK